jgi:hypothetical protein
MIYSNSDLTLAFPESLRPDVLQVVAALPEPPLSIGGFFSARVSGENVSIPYRIYHDPVRIDSARLNPQQTELLDCLLTRHHNGFVREEHLARIICRSHDWVPPFVVQLVGEYVVEILRIIQKASGNLDTGLYRRFLTDNAIFFAITKQRVVSYWDCYHRWQKKQDYPGFQILNFFDRLISQDKKSTHATSLG